MLESITRISEITGISRRVVKVKLGSIPPVAGKAYGKGNSLLYETTEVLKLLYEGGKRNANVELVDGMEPLDYERWRKTKAEATAQEMRNQITKREIAPVRLLEFAMEDFAGQAASVFESIPLKVKKRLPHLKASEIELIKREIVKTQNAASRIKINWDRLPDCN